MMYLTGVGRRGCFGLKTPQCAAIVFAALAAGCSADITRFDSTSFSLNDPPETVGSTAPPQDSAPPAPGYDSAVSRSTPRGPYGVGAGSRSVDVAALPEPVPSATGPVQAARGYGQNDWKRSPTGALATSAPYAPAAATAAQTPNLSPTAKGETIDVQPGDTLYGLSKRYRVSVSELMSVNGMTSPNLKPGQKLSLPAANAAVRAPMPRAAEVAAPPPAPIVAPTSAEVAAKYSGSYTVKAGDSLYNIARANKVPFAELQQVNGIADPRKVKPGTVLRVPGLGEAPVAAAQAMPAAVTPAAPRTTLNSTTQPTVINGGQQVAALNDRASDATPDVKPVAPAAATPAAVKADKVAAAAPAAAQQAADSAKLRWPVSGKVVAGFGGRPDGTHNDGINLSVPLGTDVHAAEGGVVAYAGSELKGYGNLMLLRHDNGWVTAYAHNDELLVKRGDKIKRGQVIGKAGKTGTVDQPQVHFELRQGSKPVDPTPFMEKI